MATLYTIGHSNISVEDFIKILKQHKIKILLDVRSAPYSKYVPHFNKRQLENHLKEAGFDYRYAGQHLGGRPDDESLYIEEINDSDTAKASDYLKQVDYIKVMEQEWYRKGINRLIEIISTPESGNLTLMCSEANPLECHRHHLLVRSLLDTKVRFIDEDIKVYHILKDGELQTVTPDDFSDEIIRQERLL